MSGPGADRAREARWPYHPGTANAVERDSENGATWEVEITGRDGRPSTSGSTQDYKLVVVEGDGEDQGGR